MNHNCPRLFYLLLVIMTSLASLLGTVSPAAGQRAASIEDVKKSWRQRQESIRSFSVNWKVTHTIAEGALRNPTVNAMLPKSWNPKGLIVPPAPYTFEAPMALKVRERKVRFDYQWHAWSMADMLWDQSPTKEYFDGISNTVFRKQNKEIWSAIKRPERYSISLANSQTRALALALCATELPLNVLNLDGLVLSSVRPVIGIIDCLLVKDELNGRQYWLHPTNYCVLRFIAESRSGAITKSLDIEWAETQGLLLPSGWRLATYSPDGTVRDNTTAFEVVYAINDDLPDSEFDVVFPPNTFIADFKNYKLKPATFSVIDSSNTKSDVTREELSKSKLGELVVPKKGILSSSIGIWIGLFGAFLVAALAFFWKWVPFFKRRSS